MKYEDIKKSKAGDKIVIKLESDDTRFSEKLSSTSKGGLVHYLFAKRQYLGKLSDFQQQEKIKFTEAEKDEFDGLTNYFSTPWAILNCIEKYHGGRRSNLYNRIFHSGSNAENAAAQFEFIKAIEHPELIEVEKEKKYRLKVLDSYICHDVENDTYWFGEKHVNTGIENVFIQSEIDELQELSEFDSIDLSGCKEAVEDETN